jgi:cell division protein FtsQ
MSARSAKRAAPAVPIRALRLVAIAVGLLGLSGAIALAKTHGIPLLRDARLPIRHVEMLGELRHMDELRVRKLLGPVLGSNLIAVDVVTLKGRLEAHPWVDRAAIARVWPDRLRVSLIEREPIARWGDREFVDASGTRFERDGESRPDLPLLLGPDGLERSLLIGLASTRERLEPLGLRLQSLNLNNRRAWTIRLDNGLELRLGRQRFAPRLERFADAYVPFLATRMSELLAVDLRYTNGFALSWRPDSGAGEAPADNGRLTDGQEG